MFEEAEKKIVEFGYKPINPMKEVPKQLDFEWIDYIKFDIKILMDCDLIYMLPNWKDSKGAKIEHDLAVS